MDHSPRFWAEVRRLYPDFEGPLAELKRLAASIPKI
jgi:predicted metal-dependent hydrolase